MDTQKLIARVKAILMTPKTEWPVIAGEQTTVADLYKNYILILAALGPVAAFIGNLIFGIHVPLLGTFRPGFGSLLTSLILGYGAALLAVFVVSLITDALAPNFGGEKNPVQALKAAAYSSTPAWVVGALMILPGVGVLVWLLSIAAAGYGIYLLYLGLPHTMKTPQDRSVGYAVAIIVVGFVINLILASVVTLSTRSSYTASALSLGSPSSSGQFDADSSLGKLDAWSKKVTEAGKQMESAQKSGDAEATGKALGAVMGAAMGGGDQVEALAPDVLKPFVPETLAGLKRTDFSAERNGAMGMQISEAHASYSDDNGRSLRLEVTDMGTAKGLMAMAGWAAIDSSKETDHGYDKTYKQDGRIVHEEWNSQDKRGEYGIVLGDRFSVKVSGNADSINDIKAAVASINLAGLEALKGQGVKKG